MYDTIKSMLVTTFKVPQDEITADSTLEDLGLDSLDMVELAAMIKDQLSAEVSEDELAALERIGSIADVVEARTAKV